MDYKSLYAQEVGRRLPEAMRADIEKEIISMIEDALEDESKAQGRKPDEAMLIEVLKRLGSPEKMAAAYLPPRYLIGPELFPYFLTTIRIVASITTLVVAILFGLSLGTAVQSSASIPEIVIRGISTVIDALFRGMAVVVLIFAIIQWARPEIKLHSTEWDPRKLKAEPDTSRVNIPGSLMSIVFSIMAIIILNFYPQWVGLTTLLNGQWVHVPILTAAFFQYLPFLTIIWVLEALQKVWLVSAGRWTNSLRWSEVAIHLLNIAALFVLLVGPDFVRVDEASFTKLGWTLPPETIQALTNSLNMSIHLALGIVIALLCLETVKQLYKLLLKNRLPAGLEA